MTPELTEGDLLCAAAGDRVGPDDAAAFLGVTPQRLAYWRKRGVRGGPPFQRLGPRLIRYGMDDLLAWRRLSDR